MSSIKQVVKIMLLKFIYLKKYIYIQLSRSKKFFIFVSPNANRNVGDLAILEAEYNFINKYFSDYKIIEINNYDLDYGWNIEKLCRESDIITINGGGFLGTLWLGEELNVQKVIQAYKNRKIITFPQTIYYDNDQKSQAVCRGARNVYESNNNFIIHVRERESEQIGHELFPNTEIVLCPDIVLSLRMESTFEGNRHGICLCLRNDCEKTNDYLEDLMEVMDKTHMDFDISDMITKTRNLIVNRKKEIQKKVDEFAAHELVITDRLHAMVFCAISRTPCLVLVSKSYKVQGVYEWLKECDYIKLINGTENIENEIKDMISLKRDILEFNNSTLDAYYEKLEEKICNE